MKKYSFKLFAVVWSVLFAVFNLAAFVIPPVASENKFEGSFWFGWALAFVGFLINLGCGIWAFKANNLQKMFYRLPLVDLSYTATVSMALVGSVIMIVNTIPQWIAGVVCLGIALVYLIAVAKTATAAFIVEDIDKKVKTGTLFIKSLTVDAESLVLQVKTQEAAAAVRKVSETVRYSDPMSNEALSSAEAQITVKFGELKDAVEADDIDEIKRLAN